MEKTQRKTETKKTSPSSKAAPRKASAVKASGNRSRTRVAEEPSPEERDRMIRDAAYFRAEKRGFAEGNPEEDWREAERELEERLRSEGKPARTRRGAKGSGGSSQSG